MVKAAPHDVVRQVLKSEQREERDMMKKSALAAAMAVLLTFASTSCGISGMIGESESSESEVSESTTEEVTEAEESSEDVTEETTEETSEESSEETTENEDVKPTEAEEFTPVEGLSENYADLEKRCFAYDGKIYTLGESTLQDLIDGGVPFDENELNNSGNNVNKNHGTSTYNVDINDFTHIQVEFINTTDSNITEAECLLSYVRWYSIYVPKPDFEDSRNEEIINNINDSAKHVCFSFPLTLTKDQLLENNDAPTEETDNNYVKYEVDSEVYMGSSGYNFEFNKDTNQLEEVSIDWLP